METNQSTIELFIEKLKNEGIGESYLLDISNLIDAILCIADISVDQVSMTLRADSIEEKRKYSLDTEGKLLQIITLAKVLKEKTDCERWQPLFDLIEECDKTEQ